MKTLIVFGTRPEAIKLFSVIMELRKCFDIKVVSTGQHKELLDETLKVLGIEPEVDLEVMAYNQSLTNLTVKLHQKISNLLDKEKPELVVVQGDTQSALVTALEAFYRKIPVAHVEAGLRSADIFNPFPEEANRRFIDQIATYNFVPTEYAYATLEQEGVWGKIYKTGNTGIDALLFFSNKITVKPKKMVLVTLHRRESFGAPLEEMLVAIRKFADEHEDFTVFFPVHPNPNVRETVYKILDEHKRIILSPPLNYIQMIRKMKESYMILTDSGGIQEEAPSLKKPVLVLREKTERPEGIAIGVSMLVGTKMDKILRAMNSLVENKKAYNEMVSNINPYGDGHAAERIAIYLNRCLNYLN